MVQEVVDYEASLASRMSKFCKCWPCDKTDDRAEMSLLRTLFWVYLIGFAVPTVVVFPLSVPLLLEAADGGEAAEIAGLVFVLVVQLGPLLPGCFASTKLMGIASRAGHDVSVLGVVQFALFVVDAFLRLLLYFGGFFFECVVLVIYVTVYFVALSKVHAQLDQSPLSDVEAGQHQAGELFDDQHQTNLFDDQHQTNLFNDQGKLFDDQQQTGKLFDDQQQTNLFDDKTFNDHRDEHRPVLFDDELTGSFGE